MLIEIFERARGTEALEIVGRRISMEMHGEQLALNEIRLRRLAQADRHIRLPHGEVELLVAGDQREAHFGIEVDELAQPRREPMHADTRARRHLELAVRFLPAVGELCARCFELHEHVMRSAIEELPLLGQNQPTRVPMEQRDRKLLFERRYLARHGRLRKPELFAGVGEAARLRGSVENLELIPVHHCSARYKSMIPKSGPRFSDKIMLKQISIGRRAALGMGGKEALGLERSHAARAPPR